MRSSSKVSCALFAFVFCLFASSPVLAQEYRIEKFSAPAPEDFAPTIRETLSADAVRVIGPEGPVCEVWLRKAVPVRAEGTKQFGIAYAQLAEGTFVAGVRVLATTSDYRRQKISPGVYMLRYALHPVDGNHMGVAHFRDFLLLAPASADSNSGTIPAQQMLELSRKASGTTHPAVWSLLSPDETPESLPAIVHEETEDLWVLYFEIPLQPSEGTARKIVMALVVIGHAPEA